MEIKINHEFTLEEKKEILTSLSIDEIFDMIQENVGNHVGGFFADSLAERVLLDYPEYLVDANKIFDLLEKLPNKENCKTSVESFVVQELNKIV